MTGSPSWVGSPPGSFHGCLQHPSMAASSQMKAGIGLLVVLDVATLPRAGLETGGRGGGRGRRRNAQKGIHGSSPSLPCSRMSAAACQPAFSWENFPCWLWPLLRSVPPREASLPPQSPSSSLLLGGCLWCAALGGLGNTGVTGLCPSHGAVQGWMHPRSEEEEVLGSVFCFPCWAAWLPCPRLCKVLFLLPALLCHPGASFEQRLC